MATRRTAHNDAYDHYDGDGDDDDNDDGGRRWRAPSHVNGRRMPCIFWPTVSSVVYPEMWV